LWGGVYGGHYWVDPKNALSLVALTNSLVAALYAPQKIDESTVSM
jgi:CubicO group peptidase (beta-lactamase class C family)